VNGFQAIIASNKRSLLSFLVKHLWRDALSIMRVYEALGRREPNAARRAILLQLAEGQRRRVALQAVLLPGLRIPTRVDRDRLVSQLWRWLLVHCGSRVAVICIYGFERCDAVLFTAALRLMKESHASYQKTEHEPGKSCDREGR